MTDWSAESVSKDAPRGSDGRGDVGDTEKKKLDGYLLKGWRGL